MGDAKREVLAALADAVHATQGGLSADEVMRELRTLVGELTKREEYGHRSGATWPKTEGDTYEKARDLVRDSLLTLESLQKKRAGVAWKCQADDAFDDLFAAAAPYMPEALAKMGRAPELELREMEALEHDLQNMRRAGVVSNDSGEELGATVYVSTVLTALGYAKRRAREAMKKQQGVLQAALAEMVETERSCRAGKIRDVYGLEDSVRQAVGVGVNRALRILHKHIAAAGEKKESE